MPVPIVVSWISAGIARVFSSRLGSWIAGAMVFLGLQWGVHEFAIEPIMAQIQAAMGTVTGTAAAWAAFFNVDRYISCIVSAYSVVAGKRVFLRKRP